MPVFCFLAALRKPVWDVIPTYLYSRYETTVEHLLLLLFWSFTYQLSGNYPLRQLQTCCSQLILTVWLFVVFIKALLSDRGGLVWLVLKMIANCPIQ